MANCGKYVNAQNDRLTNFIRFPIFLRMDIGAALADARKAVGVQQKQLAKMLGISTSYLCDLEQSRRTLSVARLEVLPPEIRQKVASAMLVSRWAEIEKLRRWADGHDLPAPRGT